MEISPTERVAENVRAALARKRASQADLAAALGMSQAAVSRRTLGKKEFALSELHIIAPILGTTVDELLDGATEPIEASA